MFACFWIYYLIKGEVQPHWELLVLFPVVLILLAAMGLGCGIIVSSLTTKYRDLAIAVTFGVQLWMYITPIVYPISSVGEGFMRTVFMINPVTPAVEILRYALLGQGNVHGGFYALSLGLTLVLFLIGVMTFNRVEKTFMDTV
jgi:lipopolysaccharide transport system permease protein